MFESAVCSGGDRDHRFQPFWGVRRGLAWTAGTDLADIDGLAHGRSCRRRGRRRCCGPRQPLRRRPAARGCVLHACRYGDHVFQMGARASFSARRQAHQARHIAVAVDTVAQLVVRVSARRRSRRWPRPARRRSSPEHPASAINAERRHHASGVAIRPVATLRVERPALARSCAVPRDAGGRPRCPSSHVFPASLANPRKTSKQSVAGASRNAARPCKLVLLARELMGPREARRRVEETPA